jgi:uncharacterized membrane protein
MIKFNKNIWFLFLIVIFLCFFNTALSYRIPIVLPVLALIALCLVPGYLFCLLFRIVVADRVENFLYAVGISLAFDLLFGLFLNTLLPVLAIKNPLSSENLQISFSAVILLITVLTVYSGKAPEISFRLPKLLSIEKIFLSAGFMVLTCILAGIYLVNGENSNAFLIFSVSLIPVLLFFLIIFHDNSFNRIYPLIIYLISFSLLMVFSLRSNYVLGFDTHEEYKFFYNTFTNEVWNLNPGSLLSASISISIVPALFEQFLRIDPQILFKILYPLLFSVVPLIIYTIGKKYVHELLAIFAACLFMFEHIFITTSANSRTSLAIFFFAFAVLVLCNKEVSNIKKYAMLMLFIAGSVFSHYTTSLIFFGIILLVYGMDTVISRFEHHKEIQTINLPLIIFFISAVFFWYGQVYNLSATGIRFIFFRLDIFNDLLEKDVGKYIGPALKMSSSLWYFTKFTQVLVFVLIGMGVLFAIYSWFQKEIQGNKPAYPVPIHRTLFFMGFVGLGMLALIIFAPFLFFGYDTGRTLELILVVLPVFLVIGACNCFNLVFDPGNSFFLPKRLLRKIQPLIQYGKNNQKKIVAVFLLFLLVPHLWLATGITYQLDGVKNSVILNSPKDFKLMDFGYAYVFDQDAMALQWIKVHVNDKQRIISDGFGDSKIGSQVNRLRRYPTTIMDLSERQLMAESVYISFINEYYGTFRNSDWNEVNITTYGAALNQKNKVYSDGAALFIPV